MQPEINKNLDCGCAQIPWAPEQETSVNSELRTVVLDPEKKIFMTAEVSKEWVGTSVLQDGIQQGFVEVIEGSWSPVNQFFFPPTYKHGTQTNGTIAQTTSKPPTLQTRYTRPQLVGSIWGVGYGLFCSRHKVCSHRPLQYWMHATSSCHWGFQQTTELKRTLTKVCPDGQTRELPVHVGYRCQQICQPQKILKQHTRSFEFGAAAFDSLNLLQQDRYCPRSNMIQQVSTLLCFYSQVWNEKNVHPYTATEIFPFIMLPKNANNLELARPFLTEQQSWSQ